MLVTQTERVTRAKKYPFEKGDTVDLKLMRVLIEDITNDGRPVRINFTFKKDLSEFVWMKWTTDGPIQCEIPETAKEEKLSANIC